MYSTYFLFSIIYCVGSAESPFLLQILEFQSTFGSKSIISNDFHVESMHITVASSFMRFRLKMLFSCQQILADWFRPRDLNPRTGREDVGAVSDVPYLYFKSGYLMTTAVYCNSLTRWVPVAFSWLNGLTAQHYAARFRAFFAEDFLFRWIPRVHHTCRKWRLETDGTNFRHNLNRPTLLLSCAEGRRCLARFLCIQWHDQQGASHKTQRTDSTRG